MRSAAHSELFAGDWLDREATPDHDAFWLYQDEFRRFVPPAGSATCEIGRGDGTISRELSSLGHRVTSVADTTALPFPDGHFDRVVAYNVLMDVPDLAAATAEAARVLAPHGTLTISIEHPLADLGSFDDAGRFVLHYNCFEPRPFSAGEQRRGPAAHWDGRSRPLADYVGALRSASLVVEDLYEPVPACREDDGFDPPDDDWRRTPLFLWLNVRHGDPASLPRH